MNVLFITEMYPLTEDFTFGIFSKKIMDAVIEQGNIKADLLFPISNLRFNKLYHKLRKRTFIKPAFVENNTSKKSLQFVQYPFLHFLKAWAVNRHLETKQKQYDLVHAIGLTDGGIVAAHLTQKLNIPSVITLTGTDINQFLKSPESQQKRRARLALLNCTKIIALSSYLKNSALQLGCPEEKIQVIANGFNAAIFKPLSREVCCKNLSLNPHKKYLLYVGTYEHVKGIDILLQAYAEGGLDKKYSLLLVGGLGEHTELVAAYKKKFPSIIERGLVDTPIVAQYINCAEAVILPSRSEGLPNIAMETIACGKPIIATHVGGTPEIIFNNLNGFLITPEKTNQLIDRIHALEKHVWDKEVIVNSSKKFNYLSCTQQIISLYKTLVMTKKYKRV